MFLENLMFALGMLGQGIAFIMEIPFPLIPIFTIGQFVYAGIALFLVIKFFSRILE